MLTKFAEIIKQENNKTVIKNIISVWDARKEKSMDEYVCIVDENSRLIEHTVNPGVIGNFAGRNIILSETNIHETTLDDLVKSRRDYVGDYVSSDGQIQLAAFAHIPVRQWVIGIHRSKRELIQDIKTGMRFSKIGFYLICGLLMPFSWVLLYLTFNIAERKRRVAEKALVENEELLRKIAENYPNSYVSIIEKDFTVGFTSGLEFKKQNLNPEDFVGMTVEEAFPDHIDIIREHYNNTFKGEECSFELLINNQYQLYHTVPLYSEEGEIPRILAIVENITERKQLESRVQQAQKMEAIGTLAGGIAHDFNNVLFAMIGFTELTMEDIPKDSAAWKNLKEVLRSAMRAKNMVKQILTFSRKDETEKKPVKVQSILKEALTLLRTSIPSTIEIRQSIDETCRPVLANSTQIHQVIMNLATNAYQAMQKEGGLMELNLVEEDISSDDSDPDLHPGTYIKLTISDTGYGISDNVIEKIFDPYFSTKEPGEGTGMGLSVVHGIIKSHGGDIRVFSKIGEGAAFQVYLPLTETEPFEPETLIAGPVPTGSEHILFVDDEESIAFMVRQTLERLGYQVTSRTSSVETLEAFRVKHNEFDLVITDMTMPNVTGLELTAGIKQIRPDIPVIICTGFSEMIDKEKAKRIGIQAFIMKPIISDEMARIIRKVIDGSKEE